MFVFPCESLGQSLMPNGFAVLIFVFSLQGVPMPLFSTSSYRSFPGNVKACSHSATGVTATIYASNKAEYLYRFFLRDPQYQSVRMLYPVAPIVAIVPVGEYEQALRLPKRHFCTCMMILGLYTLSVQDGPSNLQRGELPSLTMKNSLLMVCFVSVSRFKLMWNCHV